MKRLTRLTREPILGYCKCLLLVLLTVSVCVSLVESRKIKESKHGIMFDGIFNEKTRNGRIMTGAKRSEVRTINLKTNLGVVVGTIEFTSGVSDPNRRRFYSFRGIPYAKPPLGSLRWVDPEDLVQSQGSERLDATQYGPVCPQWHSGKRKVIGKENCLHLNVFTPFLPGSSPSTGIPVFVFIDGEAYLSGGAPLLGPERLMRENIVLVTLNYRLGILGFLSTGDSTLAGNYGALDITSALRWVQRNINDFGGDPTAVTLGGFSGGASLVHHHMVSPLAQGLFHRAVLMSGAGNCLWATERSPWDAAKKLAAHLGCPTSSSSTLKDCLAIKDFKAIVQGQKALERFSRWPFPFRPTVDLGSRNQSFMPALLKELQGKETTNTSAVPVLIGGTPEEGLLIALRALLQNESSNISSTFDEFSTYIFESTWPNKSAAEEMGKIFSEFYFSEMARHDEDVFISEMTEATTDLLFTSCIWEAAEEFAQNGQPVYTYLMTHHDPGSPSYGASLRLRASNKGIISPHLTSGISHGDDLALLFKIPGFLGQMNRRDVVMSQLLTRFWGNFVRNGSPQIDELLAQGTPVWHTLKPGHSPCYYQLSLNPSAMDRPYRHKEQNFWTRTVPMMEKMNGESSHSRAWQISTWLLLALVILLTILLLVIAFWIWRKGRTKEYSKNLPTLKTQISRLASLRRDSQYN